MAIDDIFSFAHQCCDAVQYLEMGERCAAGGDCYDALRPQGAIYWFALPFLLGIAPEWLIIWQGLLAILAALLGGLALHALWARCQPVPRAGLLLCFAVSGVSHGVWVWPWLDVSLSDLPASALALSGLWLVLWLPGRLWSLVLAGLCFGLACWLRTFFLYPFYGLLAVVLLLAFWRRQPVLLALFAGLLPVLAQYHASWRLNGEWSYLDNHWAAHWSNRHLEDASSGYDTVSMTPVRWHVSPCPGELRSPAEAMAVRDVVSLVCVELGRAYFYLGSYGLVAFQWSPRDNLLVEADRFADRPAASVWRKQALVPDEQAVQRAAPALQAELDRWLQHCAGSGAGDEGLCRSLEAGQREGMDLIDLVPQDASPGWRGSVVQRVRLQAGQSYTFSAILWAAEPLSASLALDDGRGTVLAEEKVVAEPAFRFVAVTAAARASGVHRLVVDFRGREEVVRPLLLMMEPRLVMGTEAVPPPDGSIKPGDVRHWSAVWFLLNSALAGLLLAGWWSHWRQWPVEAHGVMVFVLLCVGMALVVVPEQRFSVPFMVVAWAGGWLAAVVFARQRWCGARMSP